MPTAGKQRDAHVVLATWMAVFLLGSPSAASPCQELAPLGSPAAATRVHAYLDPIDGKNLALFVELRRLVSERPGDLSVELHWISGPGRDPQAMRAREWLVAMHARGRLEAALRTMHRDGDERIDVRLATPAQRAELAREVGLRPDVHERYWNDPCAAKAMDLAELDGRMRAELEPDASLPPPLFLADGQSSDNVDELRVVLGRLPHLRAHGHVAPPPMFPEAPAASLRLRRPEVQGVKLGGVGLPHLFFLTARSEDDPALPTLLPPVLEYRRQNPGRLAVQVVARGAGLHADRLRHRLCASAKLGLAVAYLEWLALDPLVRPFRSRAYAQTLLARLDAVPAEACANDPDPSDLSIPEGGWLDGIPQTRSELDRVANTLQQLEASRRPLQPLIPPRDAP